jgi:AAA domain
MADDNFDDAFERVFGDRDFGKHGHRHQRSDANGTRSTAPPLPAALTAEALMMKTFDPIKSVVPGVVVEGLTLFAGKPKIGKSWLLLHAAIAVATSGFTLGNIHCKEGEALYCALEDSDRRMQSRLRKLLGTQAGPKRLHIRTQCPRLAQGGLAVITDWIKSVADPRLIIVDTLAMVRAPKIKGQTDYDADYQALLALRELAMKQGIAVVVVHHLRKAEADDPFDTISGTLGLTGAADSVLVLKRDAGGTFTLHGTGRDLVELEKVLTFNRDTCVWTMAGDPHEVRASNARKAILAAMREVDEPISPTDIAAAAHLKRDSVRHLLLKMAKDGLIEKADYGKYRLAAATVQ